MTSPQRYVAVFVKRFPDRLEHLHTLLTEKRGLDALVLHGRQSEADLRRLSVILGADGLFLPAERQSRHTLRHALYRIQKALRYLNGALEELYRSSDTRTIERLSQHGIRLEHEVTVVRNAGGDVLPLLERLERTYHEEAQAIKKNDLDGYRRLLRQRDEVLTGAIASHTRASMRHIEGVVQHLRGLELSLVRDERAKQLILHTTIGALLLSGVATIVAFGFDRYGVLSLSGFSSIAIVVRALAARLKVASDRSLRELREHLGELAAV